MKKSKNKTNDKTKRRFKEVFVNKKSLFFLILGMFFIFSIWIWTIVSIKSNLINIGGSASADLVLQKLINEYQKQTNKKFNYSSTGSGAGARNVINQTYSIGFISKSQNDLSIPDEIRNNLYDDSTDFKKIKDNSSKQQVFNNLKK
nr:hypothetical protein MF5294_00474 [Mycoplasma feriruminatoris]VZR97790.1 hypothetical protein MF5295_00481 [Mycoplasma feriruminatoris]